MRVGGYTFMQITISGGGGGGMIALGTFTSRLEAVTCSDIYKEEHSNTTVYK